VAILAKRTFVVAGIGDPGYSRACLSPSTFFAQISSVQANADVRRGEADQR
jgi:hypothetical protein